jgi:hypothetical protein
LLLMGIAVTWAGNDEILSSADKKNVILFLSLAGSTVAGYVSFMNPALKWRQLRGAAMTLESHVWMFRARAGEYRVTGGQDFDILALDQLKSNIIHTKSLVMEGADMKTTNFFSQKSTSNLHGQRPAADTRAFGGSDPKHKVKMLKEHDVEAPYDYDKVSLQKFYPLPITLDADGTVSLDKVLRVIHNVAAGTDAAATNTLNANVDTHYKPLQPDRYCILRIERALEFYKGRLPRSNRARYIGQIVITLGSLVGVLLAVFDALRYAAVAAIIVSSTTAWLEFSGTLGKITRYSTTIGGLQDLLMWWRTSAPIERSATQNIDKLILTAEELLKSELNSWSSTSLASKSLTKAKMGNTNGEDENKEN